MPLHNLDSDPTTNITPKDKKFNPSDENSSKNLSTNSSGRMSLPGTGTSADFDADAVIKRGNPRDTSKANITVGELRKIVANDTKQKVYTRKDALSVVEQLSKVLFSF